MIPADLTAKLRALITLPLPEVQPVTPARRTPDDHLPPGTRFTAQVLEKLPDGNFRALVADRPVTLSLPQSATPGQVLQLVVKRQDGQTLYAQPAEPSAQPQPRAQLSQAGQLVSRFVSGDLGNTAPAQLKGGAPILQTPPGPALTAAQVAPQLARALSGSGVFYEAHQAQWVGGQMTLEQLKREPQGQLLLRTQPQPAAQTESGKAPERSTQDPAAARALATAAQPSAEGKSALPGTTLPRDIAPVVMQQLDSLVNQQLAWQGVVWPGQTMSWTIAVPDREADGTGEAEENGEWNTTLKLTMPVLGEVEATLHLTPAGLALRIQASEADTVERLETGIEKLASALEALGVPLTGHAIVHDET